MILSELFSTNKGSRHRIGKRTICELHRELYDLCVVELHDKDPELMMKMIKVLEDAFIMGVKMNKKLIKYKLGCSSKWEQKEFKNEKINKKKIRERRKRRKKLEKMLNDNNDILSEFDKKV